MQKSIISFQSFHVVSCCCFFLSASGERADRFEVADYPCTVVKIFTTAGMTAVITCYRVNGTTIFADGTQYISCPVRYTKFAGYADYFLSLFGSESGETVEITVYRNGRYVVLDTVLVEQGDDTAGWIIR